MGLEIVAARADDAVALPLVTALLAELQAAYPDDSPSPHHPDELAPPTGAFRVALLDGVAVGCGGIRLLDPETAEVKRMYTDPSARGRGVARGILSALEDAARALGCRRAVLETGPVQEAALALYRSAGYVDVPPFGAYFPFSIYLGRDLAGTGT